MFNLSGYCLIMRMSYSKFGERSSRFLSVLVLCVSTWKWSAVHLSSPGLYSKVHYTTVKVNVYITLLYTLCQFSSPALVTYSTKVFLWGAVAQKAWDLFLISCDFKFQNWLQTFIRSLQALISTNFAISKSCRYFLWIQPHVFSPVVRNLLKDFLQVTICLT